MVFRIERRTGGTVELKPEYADIPSTANAFYTGVTISVYDRMPGGTCAGKTNIIYYVSIDNGTNWVEVDGWDVVREFTIDGDGHKVLGAHAPGWTPGNPELTYRSRRVDFAGMDLTGRELRWKSELVSEDEACTPEIMDVALEGSVSSHFFFSRSSPVSLGNVLYSGNYETPDAAWSEKTIRGHVYATRIYDPSFPNATATQTLWDGGQVLSATGPGSRAIYFPNMTVTQVTNETIATGDGSTQTFSETLAHHPVVGTTVTITDQSETFEDKHTDVLQGSLGGTGTINRFTGTVQITFNTAPGDGVPIRASYSYYTTSQTLKAFTPANVTNAMLGLDNTYIIGGGYRYDFDGDDDFDEADGDWLVNWVRGYKDGASTPKSWLLGPIDHSTPALASPPGVPEWYFGSATTKEERESFDTFQETYKERQTVLYVGARDGMLHAFDAGKFRWGDNPETPTIREERGYFLWEGGLPNYGTGGELWAFIPNNLIPRLKHNRLKGDDRAYVDASPAIADVYTDGQWRSVVLCAEGNGGDTVFALDVTNPTAPSFLWEFADPDLFRSRSSPAIAQIGKIVHGGEKKWAAFFVSGKTYDPNLYPSVYMIDIADGSVIQRVFLTAGAGGISSAGGVPSGQPAIVDSDGNGYIDRVYVGTNKGFMYKINLPDYPDRYEGTISHCIINTDFVDPQGVSVPETQRYHPIYACPSVVVANEYKSNGEIDYRIKIFFGTGDNPYYDENINMTETQYYFFAYVDGDGKGGDGSACELDWFYALPEGHRVFASAFSAAGNVYFGTATSDTEDPCGGANAGKLYGFTWEGEMIMEQQVGDTFTSPVVSDEHVYFRTVSGVTSVGSNRYNNPGPVGGFPRVTIKSWKEIF
jgi:hypothetical protein